MVVPFLERLEVVDPDLGHLRQIPQGQPLRLTGTSELFGHRWHPRRNNGNE